MKTRAISKFVKIAALVSMTLIQVGWTFAQTSATVKFKLFRGYMIVIPVTVNNSGPFQFLLDTGTNTSIVSPEFARARGLKPIDRAELMTAAGSQIVPRVKLERVTWGGKSVHKSEALISDLREIHAIEPTIDGVIGQNVLAQFNYLLDYAERRILIDEDGSLECNLGGLRQPINIIEGRILISAQQGMRLLLDSGISTLFLFRRSSDFELSQDKSRPFVARTELGSRAVSQKRLRSFSIGKDRFSDLPVILIESQNSVSPQIEDRVEDGLLPTSLFRKIYFNHQKGFVIFNPS